MRYLEPSLQHGAQRGSKERRIDILNNAIRQTKNKYKLIRQNRAILCPTLKEAFSQPSIQNKHCTKASNTKLNENSPIESSRDILASEYNNLSLLNNHRIGFQIPVERKLVSKNNFLEDIYARNKELFEMSKIVGDQIQQLKNQVDTIKIKPNDTKSNTLGHLTQNFKVCGSNVDSRNVQRQIDRMLKVMPIFKGDSNDNFESWVLSVKNSLSYGYHCSEEQKVDVVMTKVRDYALQALEYSGEKKTVEMVIQALKKTYGKDQRAIISNMKQLPTESVKLFSVRLKNNLRALGISEDSVNPSLVALDYFVSGLIPTISKRVKSLLPETYSAAESYAFQIECENLNFNSNKGNSINNIVKADLNKDGFNENHHNGTIHEKLNFLSEQISKITAITNMTSTSNSGVQNPYSLIKVVKPYFGSCFGCNMQGHTFWNCPSITNKKREEISSNFSAYLAKYRSERTQNI